jgi:hypothetical protein
LKGSPVDITNLPRREIFVESVKYLGRFVFFRAVASVLPPADWQRDLQFGNNLGQEAKSCA